MSVCAEVFDDSDDILFETTSFVEHFLSFLGGGGSGEGEGNNKNERRRTTGVKYIVDTVGPRTKA